MGSKRIVSCDKCHAQFDMSDPVWGQKLSGDRWPVYIVKWEVWLGQGSGTAKGEAELCKPCRDVFIKMNREFLK